MPSGKTRRVQGYEPYALGDLLEDRLIIDEEDYTIGEDEIITGINNVPTVRYEQDDGSMHTYYPDIFLPSLDCLIEVKSLYTLFLDIDKNVAKAKACLAQKYYYKIWAYNHKGQKIASIDFSPKYNNKNE